MVGKYGVVAFGGKFCKGKVKKGNVKEMTKRGKRKKNLSNLSREEKNTIAMGEGKWVLDRYAVAGGQPSPETTTKTRDPGWTPQRDPLQ